MENNYEKFQNSKKQKKSKKIIGSENSVLSKILNSQSNSLQKAMPIILVPDEFTAGNINLQNAQKFIEQGQYTQE